MTLPAGPAFEGSDQGAFTAVDGLSSASAPAAGEPLASVSAAAAPASGPYARPAATPTQSGPEGIFFDFNQGCRVLLPPRETGNWRARLRDLDTGNILFETENKGALIRSSKRWYVRFSIEVWSIEEGQAEPRLVLNHEYDAAGRDVLIQFPGRHAWQFHRLVLLCLPLRRASSRLSRHLRDCAADHTAAARRLS